MKPTVIATIVASFIAVILAMRKRDSMPSIALADTNKRYDIDEFIGTEEL